MILAQVSGSAVTPTKGLQSGLGTNVTLVCAAKDICRIQAMRKHVPYRSIIVLCRVSGMVNAVIEDIDDRSRDRSLAGIRHYNHASGSVVVRNTVMSGAFAEVLTLSDANTHYEDSSGGESDLPSISNLLPSRDGGFSFLQVHGRQQTGHTSAARDKKLRVSCAPSSTERGKPSPATRGGRANLN